MQEQNSAYGLLTPRFAILGLAGSLIAEWLSPGGQALNRFSWILPADHNAGATKALANALDIPQAGARFLLSRDKRTPEDAKNYLFTDEFSTHDPFEFTHMERAVSIVAETIRDKKKVLIHGDYDVDGISGTALLYQFLKSQVSEVKRFLPDRRRDGYGLSKRAADWAVKNDVGLLIAVDCGTSDGALVGKLLDEGIEVIVCDHHEFPPDGGAKGIILNPVREGETYPFPHLCGAGVAFKLARALEASGFAGDVSTDQCLDLVALATVGDLALLTGENRYYVRAGLEQMNLSLRIGLKALKDCARLNAPEITANHISFVLAPRLNAPGRVSNAKPSLEILCTDNMGTAAKLGMQLERENDKRKEFTEIVRREVDELIDAMPDREDKGAFVLAREGWDEGVLGIAAARVVEKYGKAAILISIMGELAKGSGRSVPGVHLKAQLDRCRHHLKRYGGHAQAVGLTIETSRLAAFEEEFSAGALEAARGLPAKPELPIDSDLTIDECSMELLEFLSMCEPFGLGNKTPVWRMRNMHIDSRTGFVGNSHLKLFFHDENRREAEAIRFNWRRPLAPEELHGRTVDLAVTLKKGFFRERFFPEIRMVDIKLSDKGRC
jgi:single-stranded-DNA-specific exonuclease